VLSELVISKQDVLDQLKTLDPSKAFGPDKISPRFLKEGAVHLAVPLCKLFNASLQCSVFPDIWKKANVLPLHKKDSKDTIDNYRPISLLSCVGKVFERIIFKYLYNHLKDNFVLCQEQSGFLPGRSTTTQLIEVYDSMCTALNNSKEIRVVFLDISKAFDKVWHKVLLHKLKQCGVGTPLVNWFSSYLHKRQQRVVINGSESSWGHIPSGVPQGSVLGPLLFLIYINDITHEVLNCKIRLFADDTCLFIEVDDRVDTCVKINDDLSRISRWANRWLVTFSPTKTKSLTISNKKDIHLNPPIYFAGTAVNEVKSHMYLGLLFTCNLKWTEHINLIYLKARKRLSLMTPLKYELDRKTLHIMFTSFVRPVMEYGNVVWGGTYDSDMNKLEKINVDGMRLLTGATANSNIRKLYEETAWQSVRERCDAAMATMLYKIKHFLTPNYLTSLLPRQNSDIVPHNLRNREHIKPPYARLETYKRSFLPYAINIWNSLTSNTRNMQSLHLFKQSLKDVEANVLYYYGKRWAQIHHARIRMGCSLLNYDLCYKVYVIDNPACRCGASMETAFHFFMECPLYQLQRENMVNTIERYANCTLQTILRGTDTVNLEDNKHIFDAVHTFIYQSHRFR